MKIFHNYVNVYQAGYLELPEYPNFSLVVDGGLIDFDQYPISMRDLQDPTDGGT